MPIIFETRKLPTGGKLITVQAPGARPGVGIKLLAEEAIALGLVAPPGEGEKKEEPVRNKARRASANKEARQDAGPAKLGMATGEG